MTLDEMDWKIGFADGFALRRGRDRLLPGGSVEPAAGHPAGLRDSRLARSPRTTKLYDRTSDAITLDEIERVAI